MKKILMGFLCVIMFGIISGCSGEGEGKSININANTEKESVVLLVL